MDNNKSIIYDELDTEHSADVSSNRLEGCSGDYIARRLTPTECARLQGFPPDWCADVPHTDSAEYKLWGNGIALPTILGFVKAMGDVIRDEP